mmetsp:Transcript_48232/g.108480  ORF Transcript_48232/g.108480 Transcript_48232/m.108480 type:complete len:689 (-) Transcript_48232:42-2108(-)
MKGADSHHLSSAAVSSVLQVLRNSEEEDSQTSTKEPRLPRRRWQRTLLEILQSRYFEGLVAFAILLNLMVMIVEADQNADCDVGSCSESFISLSNLAFTTFYTVELSMRIAASQCDAFNDKWNVLDALIVAVGWIQKIFEQFNISFNWLRLLRLTRLSRASRFPLRRFPELHMLVVGFGKAMVAMFWGSVMILCMLLLWSLLVVELVHPENRLLDHEDPHCAFAYSTVWRAFVTLFQTIVAGDSWGHCSLDVIDSNFAMFVPFGLAFVTVQLGTMNLILSVIVDHAAKAREENQEEKARLLLQHRKRITMELHAILESVDTDASGTLTYEEFCEGYVVNSQLRKLVQELNLCEDDFRILFDIMDTQRVGCVSYHAFIEFLQNMTPEQLQQHLLMARLLKKRDEAFTGLVERLAEHAGVTASPPNSPKTKKRERAWHTDNSDSRRSSTIGAGAGENPWHDGQRGRQPDFTMKVARCQLQFNDMLAKMGNEFDKIMGSIQSSMSGNIGGGSDALPPSSARSRSGSRQGSKQRLREHEDSAGSESSSSLPRLPKEPGGLSPASSPLHAVTNGANGVGFGAEALSDLSELTGRIKSTHLAVTPADGDDTWRCADSSDRETEGDPTGSDTWAPEGAVSTQRQQFQMQAAAVAASATAGCVSTSGDFNGRHVGHPRRVRAAEGRKRGERLRQHL